VFLRKPILSGVVRQAWPHVPFTTTNHKHIDTGHALPDFSLRTTCKFAVQAVAWLTALATGPT
jgi:hypothetical protein